MQQSGRRVGEGGKGMAGELVDLLLCSYRLNSLEEVSCLTIMPWFFEVYNFITLQHFK